MVIDARVGTFRLGPRGYCRLWGTFEISVQPVAVKHSQRESINSFWAVNIGNMRINTLPKFAENSSLPDVNSNSNFSSRFYT